MNQGQTAAQMIWQWRAPVGNSPDGGRARRRRALIQCALTAAIATLLTLWFGRYRLGVCLYCFAAVIIIFGFLLPKAFAALERLGRKLAHAAGFALTWILLAPFFYLCFAPARLILALSGKDPMQRRLDRGRTSYWMDYTPPKAARPYTRQY